MASLTDLKLEAQELRLLLIETHRGVQATEEWLSRPPEDTTDTEIQFKIDLWESLQESRHRYSLWLEEVEDEIEQEEEWIREMKQCKKERTCYCHLLLRTQQCDICAKYQ